MDYTVGVVLLRTLVLFFLLLNTVESKASSQLHDEVSPRPNLSERFLGVASSSFGAQALTSVGLDSIDSSSNGQSARRSFAAYGGASRVRLYLGTKLILDGGVIGTVSSAESDFVDDSSWSRKEARSELVSDLVGRFVTSDGISFGGGVNFLHNPGSVEQFRFANMTAEVTSESAKLFATELIVTKVASGWSAGFGWREKKSTDRRVTRSSSGESLEFFDNVGLDEQISAGVTAQLMNGTALSFDVRTSTSESDFINLAGTGEKSSADPQRRYEVFGLYSLGDYSAQRLSFGVGYRAIGYSTQTSVSAQSIPMWTFLLRDRFKLAGAMGQVDALIGYGEDLQSLPDFNANYRRILVTIQAGVIL